MQSLFPEIQPYLSYFLQVSHGHEIYVEEVGNPDGHPMLFLHGGPGAGLASYHRRYFDPDFYRIILFDQRGSGKSKPSLSLEHNTTDNLIQDMEIIRQHCQVESWSLFGGSWGSTLAMAYAISRPSKVKSLILRGIFLGRKEDINWFYEQGASELKPEEFLLFNKEQEANVKAYYEILNGDLSKKTNEKEKKDAALAWSRWEAKNLTLKPLAHHENEFMDESKAIPLAKIETHYFFNECFLAGESAILNNTHCFKDIPITLVHGRYDTICSFKQAWLLHQSIPHAEFIICENSGHSGLEPEIINALVETTNRHKAFHYS